MQIIISPAKQMKISDDNNFKGNSPILLDQSLQLMEHLKMISLTDLKKYFKCSDKIAQASYEQIQSFEMQETSNAILSYNGIQYQYMHPDVFTNQEMQFLCEHLWILSGLYGALRPLDEIRPYRLEMQCKCPFSLYEFWKDSIANVIPDEPILNLASEEYAKCIRKYRALIDVRFCQNDKGKLVEKGVYAKMARGAMVRYIAENQINDLEGLYGFCEFGYAYSAKDSTQNLIVYIQKEGLD